MMKKKYLRNNNFGKKTVSVLLASVLAAGLMSLNGCSGDPAKPNAGSENETRESGETGSENAPFSEPESSEIASSKNDGTGTEGTETNKTETDPSETPSTEEESSENTAREPIDFRIGSLKGPTSIGLAPLMTGNRKGDPANEYDFRVEATADVLLTAFMKDEIDAALIPANAAAVWYKKFTAEDGSFSEVTVIDINTLGVLYLMGPEETSELKPFDQAASSLKGKKVFMTGQGTTPEYVFSYLLSGNDVDPADVKITWFSEATEVVSALAADPEAYAVLPQPYVTVAAGKLPSLHMISSLSDGWDQLNQNGTSRQVTGVTLVRTSFLKDHPEAVDRFLEDHRNSVKAALADPKTTAGEVVKAGIIDNAAIAEKALPYCSLVCITGSEMKDALSGYLKVLFDANPKSVGGKLPGDDFYYLGNRSVVPPKNNTEEGTEIESEQASGQETGSVPAKEPKTYAATPANVKELGRYQTSDQATYYAHSGCGAEFTVTGKTCKVSFVGDSQSSDPKYLAYFARILVYVDDVLTDDFLLNHPSKEITVFDREEECTSVVRILKASEANLSCYGIAGITTDGTISPTAPKDLKMEFIGDSITSAYGVDAKEGDDYSSLVENITEGYAYLCAKELDADYSIVCASGCGVVSGYAPDRVRNTANLMPAIYGRLGGNVSSITEFHVPPSMIGWDFSLFQPDVVVINLGTNDGSYARDDSSRLSAFEFDYVSFLKTIRKNNPDALIVCTLGLMGDDLYPNIENAVNTYIAETADRNVTSMRFDVQNISEDGVALDCHPSVKTHEKAASKLTAFLKEHLENK